MISLWLMNIFLFRSTDSESDTSTVTISNICCKTCIKEPAKASEGTLYVLPMKICLLDHESGIGINVFSSINAFTVQNALWKFRLHSPCQRALSCNGHDYNRRTNQSTTNFDSNKEVLVSRTGQMVYCWDVCSGVTSLYPCLWLLTSRELCQ